MGLALQESPSIDKTYQISLREQNACVEFHAKEASRGSCISIHSPQEFSNCESKNLSCVWRSSSWNEDLHVIFESDSLDSYSDESVSLFSGQKFPLGDFLRYTENRGEIDLSPLYLFQDLSLFSSGNNPPFDKGSLKEKLALAMVRNPPVRVPDLFEFIKLSKCEIVRIKEDKVKDISLSTSSSTSSSSSASSYSGRRREISDERPSYQWILMGGKRSGSGLHQDPHGE